MSKRISFFLVDCFFTFFFFLTLRTPLFRLFYELYDYSKVVKALREALTSLERISSSYSS